MLNCSLQLIIFTKKMAWKINSHTSQIPILTCWKREFKVCSFGVFLLSSWLLSNNNSLKIFFRTKIFWQQNLNFEKENNFIGKISLTDIFVNFISISPSYYTNSPSYLIFVQNKKNLLSQGFFKKHFLPFQNLYIEPRSICEGFWIWRKPDISTNIQEGMSFKYHLKKS